MNWIITKLLKWAGSKLDGYKTKIGGAGLILLGSIGAVNLIWPDAVPGIPAMDMDGIIGSISTGFVALGLGHKLDKNTEAVNGQQVFFPPDVSTGSGGITPAATNTDGISPG